MTRKTKALSGASQDAYFRRVLKTYPDLPEAARERIVRHLRSEIAQLRVRAIAREAADAAQAEARPDDVDARTYETVSATANLSERPTPEASEPAAAELGIFVSTPPAVVPPFDPFAINVIVVLRTVGKNAALEALNQVADTENLRLLAREQRLSVDEDLATTEALSEAIVAAAERRIANRRAAAGA